MRKFLIAVAMAVAVAFGGANTALAGCPAGTKDATEVQTYIEQNYGLKTALLEGDAYAKASEVVPGAVQFNKENGITGILIGAEQDGSRILGQMVKDGCAYGPVEVMDTDMVVKMLSAAGVSLGKTD